MYQFALLLLVAPVALIGAESNYCYFCNTEVHGQGCQDPIDESSIQIHRCSDSSIVSLTDTVAMKSSYVREILSEFKEKNLIQVRTYSNVCVNMTYTFSSRSVSARGCEVANVNTNIGVLDICSYYQAILPIRITNFACSACTTDLCNHEGFQEDDTADDGSDDGSDNGNDDGNDDGQDNGDSDGGNNADGNDRNTGSVNAVVSVTLLVVAFLAKLF